MLPVNNFEYPAAQASWGKNFPYAIVVEHPSPNSLRFRYECERRCAGKVHGEHSTAERKTFPSIQIFGYKGPAVIVVSCVTRDDPPRPHPHSIMGRNSNSNGIYSLKVNLIDGLVSFNHLGIQCMKRKQVASALEMRKRENVDPFNTGFDHINRPDSIDLNSLRLCFQVFIQGPQKKFNVPLKPVLSNPVYDKKAKEDLKICKLSVCSAPVSGGTEVILLCGKISRDDIQIRFYELRNDWVFWEDFGEFQSTNVHKQVAIVFRTPAYCNQDITEPVGVQIQLRKKSDGSTSKPLPFLMLPVELGDTNMLKRKRARFDNPKTFMLRQMQIQTEKQNANLNQSLLLNPEPKEIFPEAANFPENNNYIPREQLNIHCESEIHERFATPNCSIPVPMPRTTTPKEVEEPKKKPRVRTTPRARIRKVEQQPQPQPRERFETPPPNITIHSYAYPQLPEQWRELDRYPRFSQTGNQQTERNDQMFFNEFPCDIDSLGQQTLTELGTQQNADNSDTISDNLSKALSISDEIQDTFQNIKELNRNVEESQQRIHGKYMGNYHENETTANNSTWNCAMEQIYEPNENTFFS